VSGAALYGRFRLPAAGLFCLLLIVPLAFTVAEDGSGIRLRGTAVALPDLCLRKTLTGTECSTCGLGRSVVLAASLKLQDSRRAHPGGAWLWGWLASMTLLRIAAAAGAVPIRFWWLDLGVTALSWLVVTVTIRITAGLPPL